MWRIRKEVIYCFTFNCLKYSNEYKKVYKEHVLRNLGFNITKVIFKKLFILHFQTLHSIPFYP